MSRQSFTAPGLAEAPPSSHTAVASTASRTNLWVPALWTPISAFEARAGMSWTLRAGGIISNTGTPTIIFNVCWGASTSPASNITFGASQTVTTVTSLANASWYLEFHVVVRSLGLAASGSTMTGNGFVVIGGPATTAAQVIGVGGTVITTADHSTAQGLVADVTWGASSASNTITAQWTKLSSD
jgi:predicted fused transcriptional regulator/phosphomethylpyrimidine kinase